ncbi:hypothetical protein Belba_1775 [Belliella baltica DSM 15883]|uniref:DUF4221 domain-containing protein n=1 Tax=Belliella baltica (strain DSM 15883 / CIP 108006 / LMG 21964 / BA134) TaxID=866536 RepID=I3Z556_BELBD|nr:hypothetical protein [Belliella baltica]AFL84374.1 hypothetical protein Belba_1775 [Belliella baltica DSM 15883]
MRSIHKQLLHLSLLGSVLFSCSQIEENIEANPSKIIELELLDSLVIDELSILRLQDINLEAGKALFVSNNKNLFLTDLNGEKLQEYELNNDGPDGLGRNGAFGYKFLDKDRFVAQGLMTSYFIYNLEGKQLQKVPYNSKEIYRITIYNTRTTFHPYIQDGQMMMIGEELNFFSAEESDPKTLGISYYDKISNIYRYNLETEENEILESYPASWEPRANQRFVGNNISFVALHDTKKSYVLLPLTGSQLFIYEIGEEIKLSKEIQLQHPERPDFAPAISPDNSSKYNDYPSFNNVLYAGEYCLVQFQSKIPESKMNELRAISEQYWNSDEYKEASKQYVKPYFILVKNGEQIGVINEMPVKGSVEFLDKNGVIYINDNANPEEERDYNVFYKVKIVD